MWLQHLKCRHHRGGVALSTLCAVPLLTWVGCSRRDQDVDPDKDRSMNRKPDAFLCDQQRRASGLLLQMHGYYSANGAYRFSLNQTHCEQQNEPPEDISLLVTTGNTQQQQQKADEPLYFGLFPKRQLHVPNVPYPLWDYDWDGRLAQSQHYSTRELRKHGVTRHIILIRHGQYDETHRHDEARVLTVLGEKQAHQTGQRLARLIQNIESDGNLTDDDINYGIAVPQQDRGKVVAIRVSNLTRAKQTADIIAQYLPPSVTRFEPDEDLNEGRPSHAIPCTDKPIYTHASISAYDNNNDETRRLDIDVLDPTSTTPQLDSNLVRPIVPSSIIRQTDQSHDRIERAFHRYFYRNKDMVLPRHQHDELLLMQDSDSIMDDASKDTTPNKESHTAHPMMTTRHEYEIIVCHANVIRYFICRALQIPPEAWLRFCVFNCSLTYLVCRPTGSVSCRMVGDIGHLDYDMTTFSMHHGFNW